MTIDEVIVEKGLEAETLVGIEIEVTTAVTVVAKATVEGGAVARGIIDEVWMWEKGKEVTIRGLRVSVTTVGT